MRDNKNILLILLVLSFLLSLLTIFVVAEGGIPSVSAKSSTLYEPTTNDFLLEKNADLRLPMASTTKIMTALIAIEKCDLNEEVIIPKEATGIEGSSIYMKEGDRISVKDLIYSVLLQSANDAATALAIKIGGDVKGFADIMNEYASKLGLKNTRFQNPHGLDEKDHYTTARDLALLASAALKNDAFKAICSTYKHTFMLSDSPRVIFNHNKLLKRYDGAIGVKTGFTDESGRCLVSAAERNGICLIAVTMNAPDDWNDHTKMLNFGFDNYEAIPMTDLCQSDFIIPIKNGTANTVKATVKDAQQTLVHRKGEAPLAAKTTLIDGVNAPVEIGDKLGEIKFYRGNELALTLDIVSEESVAQIKKNKNLFDFLKELF